MVLSFGAKLLSYLLVFIVFVVVIAIAIAIGVICAKLVADQKAKKKIAEDEE